MDSGEKTYEDIYLFEIEQTPGPYFARFRDVYKRDTAASRQAALDDILKATLPSGWRRAYGHNPSDLDMRFERGTAALIFVRTPPLMGGERTIFGERVVLDIGADLLGTPRVVHAPDSHEMPAGEYGICSFEIDITGFGKDSDYHYDTRLPIMFDFIDLPDGTSPVLKEPHTKHFVGLGHGGIHPPGATSMIMIA